MAIGENINVLTSAKVKFSDFGHPVAVVINAFLSRCSSRIFNYVTNALYNMNQYRKDHARVMLTCLPLGDKEI